MEYLVSAPAQQQYAKANFEYPVLKGVTLDPVISATIGEIDVDKIPLTEIVKYRKQASLLVDKVDSINKPLLLPTLRGTVSGPQSLLTPLHLGALCIALGVLTPIVALIWQATQADCLTGIISSHGCCPLR